MARENVDVAFEQSRNQQRIATVGESKEFET
jgi:hypothetical protein